MHCLDNELDNWAINGLTRELSQGIESKRVNVWTDHEKHHNRYRFDKFYYKCDQNVHFFRTDKIKFDAK